MTTHRSQPVSGIRPPGERTPIAGAATRDVLQAAVQHHKSGDLPRAENLYRQILRLDPGHADALHLFGVLAHQTGRLPLAVESFEQAERVQRANPVFHYNFGRALADARRPDEALAHYRQALRLRGDFLEPYLNLAVTLIRQGRAIEAIAWCREGLKRFPEHFQILINLATALERTGRGEESLDCFQRAVRARDDVAQTHNELGGAYQRRGDLMQAADCFRKAIDRDPNSWVAHNNLGRALHDLGRLAEARASYDRALALAPHSVETHLNLGTLSSDLGQAAGAMECYRRAIALRPGCVEAWHNAGVLHEDQGDWEKALGCFDAALRIQPDHADTRYERGTVLLREGRFAEGWSDYEWRWRRAAAPRRPKLPFATWDGESLAGTKILVLAEQGVGDEILFASCYADLISAASQCVITCEPRLESLWRRSFPAAQVVPCERSGAPPSAAALEGVGRHVAAGSLPRFFRREENDFPSRRCYLVPDGSSVARWRDRLGLLGDGLKVGISWRGGSRPKEIRRRSTNLEQWLPLLSTPGVCWISLQHGDAADEITALRVEHGIHVQSFSEADPAGNLDHLAALTAALDQVVTVQNTTAHLAGALGVETWALLPFSARWVWLRDRDTSPWYPSARLFRQRVADDWGDVFARVASALRDRVSSRPA